MEEGEEGGRRGRKRKVEVLEYCFEPEAEPAYQRDLLKAFQRAVQEARYRFIIVDAPAVKASGGGPASHDISTTHKAVLHCLVPDAAGVALPDSSRCRGALCRKWCTVQESDQQLLPPTATFYFLSPLLPDLPPCVCVCLASRLLTSKTSGLLGRLPATRCTLVSRQSRTRSCALHAARTAAARRTCTACRHSGRHRHRSTRCCCWMGCWGAAAVAVAAASQRWRWAAGMRLRRGMRLKVQPVVAAAQQLLRGAMMMAAAVRRGLGRRGLNLQ